MLQVTALLVSSLVAINLASPLFPPDLTRQELSSSRRTRRDATQLCGRLCELAWQEEFAQQDLIDNRYLAPTKKDVFVSRGWGAGGMPFSVLYMNPKATKGQRSPPMNAELIWAVPPDYGKMVNAVASKVEQHAEQEEPHIQPLAKSRSGVGTNSVPSRRQYSIIPQLFVSYGWGPLGK